MRFPLGVAKAGVAATVAALCVAGMTLALVPTVQATTTANVTIKGYAFTPQTINVVIGVNNTVTWTNMDHVNHAPVANDGSWGGTAGAGGGTYTHTFTTPGTFHYHCGIHPYMTGTVVVLSAGVSTTSSTTTTTSSQPPSTSTASPTSTGAASSYSSSGGVPEFPYGIAAVIAITFAIVVSYLATRQAIRPFKRSR